MEEAKAAAEESGYVESAFVDGLIFEADGKKMVMLSDNGADYVIDFTEEDPKKHRMIKVDLGAGKVSLSVGSFRRCTPRVGNIVKVRLLENRFLNALKVRLFPLLHVRGDEVPVGSLVESGKRLFIVTREEDSLLNLLEADKTLTDVRMGRAGSIRPRRGAFPVFMKPDNVNYLFWLGFLPPKKRAKAESEK
jgi:hypothetical protein